MLMMFYTTVAGWMILYFVKMARGDFVGLDTAGVAEQFGTLMGQPGVMLAFMGIVVLLDPAEAVDGAGVWLTGCAGVGAATMLLGGLRKPRT